MRRVDWVWTADGSRRAGAAGYARLPPAARPCGACSSVAAYSPPKAALRYQLGAVERWGVRFVAETEQPGSGIAEIGRRYEISQGLLWNWRSKVRRGVLRATVRWMSCTTELGAVTSPLWIHGVW